MLLLEFVLAMLPIIWLVAALSGLKMAGHKACLIALLFTMAPIPQLSCSNRASYSLGVCCFSVNCLPSIDCTILSVVDLL